MMDLLKWFRKEQPHQHYADGCLAIDAVELDDGTIECGMGFSVDVESPEWKEVN